MIVDLKTREKALAELNEPTTSEKRKNDLTALLAALTKLDETSHYYHNGDHS